VLPDVTTEMLGSHACSSNRCFHSLLRAKQVTYWLAESHIQHGGNLQNEGEFEPALFLRLQNAQPKLANM